MLGNMYGGNMHGIGLISNKTVENQLSQNEPHRMKTPTDVRTCDTAFWGALQSVYASQ